MAMQLTQLPCFQHLNWRPDRAELRRFAVAMFVGFGVLGLLAALRAWNVTQASVVLWTLGVALAAGARLPGLGRGVYLLIYVPASLVGYVVSHLVLTLMFFLVFAPLGLVLRALGYDLLQQRRTRGATNWRTTHRSRPTTESYYHQF